MTIRSLLNAPLALCEVEVYSERRGTLFVYAYDNKSDSGDDPHLYTVEYDTCMFISS